MASRSTGQVLRSTSHERAGEDDGRDAVELAAVGITLDHDGNDVPADVAVDGEADVLDPDGAHPEVRSNRPQAAATSRTVRHLRVTSPSCATATLRSRRSRGPEARPI